MLKNTKLPARALHILYLSSLQQSEPSAQICIHEGKVTTGDANKSKNLKKR